jgi:hypothetical protein
MKLVASLIIKNEFDRYLKPCIEHLLTYCDEVRVLDDGSTDGGFEWLGGLRRPVFVKKNPGPSFYEHEGRARQALLEFTMQAEPDWVLSIDADEFVGARDLRTKIDPRWDVYTLWMNEVWRARDESFDIRVDNLWIPRQCPSLWKAPQTLGGAWMIQDKQLACGREPLAAAHSTRRRQSDVNFFHFGWACEADRQSRFDRYMVHDKGQFHNNAHLQSIMWPDSRVGLRTMEWPAGLRDVKDEVLKRSQRGENKVPA